MLSGNENEVLKKIRRERLAFAMSLRNKFVNGNQSVIDHYKQPDMLLTEGDLRLMFARFLSTTQHKPVNVELDDFYRKFVNTANFIGQVQSLSMIQPILNRR
jgi:hypothetical protein